MLIRRRLLNFLTVIGQNVPETWPAFFRNSDGSTKVSFHLRYSHINPATVLSNVKIEVLVVHMHVPALGQVGFVRVLVGAKLVQQIGECVAELDHPLGGYGDLGARPATGDGLGDAQKAAPRVLLQVQVVAAVLFEHHLALQLTIFGYVVGIWGTQGGVVVAER